VLLTSSLAAHAEGLVYVASTPAGAQIAVDGKMTQHRTPVQLLLRGGAHKISVMKSGHEIGQQRVNVLDGKVVRIQLTLVPATGQPTPPPTTPRARGRLVTGTVTLVTDVIGADIALDGKPTGLKTPISVRVPIGRHTVRMSYGSAYVDETVTIHKGNNAQIRVNLRAKTATSARQKQSYAPLASDPSFPAWRATCLKQCKAKNFTQVCIGRHQQCVAQCPGQVAGKVVNPGFYYPCVDVCKNRNNYCLESEVSSCKSHCNTGGRPQ